MKYDKCGLRKLVGWASGSGLGIDDRDSNLET